MTSLILGVAMGLYAGNPAVRANVDATVKRLAGTAIDALNGKAAPPPPQDDDGEE